MTTFVNNVSNLQASLARQQEALRITRELSKAEEEATTGLRADVFRDLGARAASSISVRNQIDRTDSFVTSNKLLEGRMDITVNAMTEMRAAIQDVMAMAVANKESPVSTAPEVQAAARTALEQFIGFANTQYQGKSLFAGVDDDKIALNKWDQDIDGFGTTPESVVADITGTGPVNTADATAMIASLDTLFNSTDYEDVFFNGTPEATGERVTARIDEGVTLAYGVQANDQAFRDVIKGLTMLASVDISQISDSDAYSVYMTEAVSVISSGTSGVLEAEARLGSQQHRLENTVTGQEDLLNVLNSRVLALEAVDPYEAATRLQLLETQLQSSYVLTSRLANMTLLNYLA